ncbi:16625_t:CDS:2 [Funneliformis geosporum]|uniref:15926_t:CDS:1 n=1 Tax=Funneliformis geosporum TaxID=1117311 RepID=A0A9W4WYS7_9GLOM|nr:16625_t:CDS:2 [Funneliformis geosporum]CAI2173639.1 15926_t:CDS:2 [Funneliformis geosporum]
MTSEANLVQDIKEQPSSNNVVEDCKNSEMNTMATILQSSIQGVQNSFSTVYSTLASNLKQSLEMTQTMNSVMEQFLLSNLRITSNITPIHDSEAREEKFIPSLLTITITNSGQFPIPNMSCYLTFGKKGYQEHVNVELNCDESIKCEITKSDSKRTPISSIFVPESCNVSTTSSTHSTLKIFTLPPQTQIIEKLRLAPFEFSQYSAKINLRFSSPGTGKLLQKEHSFGLYLIDQCEKHLRFQSSTDLANYNVMVELSPYLLRQLWNVHPSSGLSETMIFEINWKNEMFLFVRIKEWIGIKKSKVLCQVLDVNTESNYSEIVERIVEELKILGDDTCDSN